MSKQRVEEGVLSSKALQRVKALNQQEIMHFKELLVSCTLLFSSCLAFAPSSAPCWRSIKSRAKGITQIRLTNDNADDASPATTEDDNDLFSSRRQALASLTGAIVGLGGLVSQSDAAVTDETNTFANTAKDSSYRGLSSSDTPTSKAAMTQSKALASDEVLISIPKSQLQKGLGLELSQVDFRTNIRVYVKSVEPNSIADQLGIQKDFIVVRVNGKSAERTNAEGVAILVSQAVKATPDNGTIEIVFRNPAVFNEKLANLSGGGEVTTQVAPAGDQKVTVTQLVPPKMCNRKATTDDLLEISYVGTVVETGEIFDGSAIKINGEGIPGRGNDVSLYFVLRKQPFGQFPPAFDVGLEGMCVVSFYSR